MVDAFTSALVGLLLGIAVSTPILYWWNRRILKRYYPLAPAVSDTPKEKIDLSEFSLDPKSNPPELEIYHRDGIDWLDAPAPDRRHTCRTQTFAWTNVFTAVHRCACGAIKIAPGGWQEKNSKLREEVS
jgi:hypothetical protein